MTDESIHIMTGAYAAGALDEFETRMFETHLVECEACRDEVDELQATTALLADAVAVDVRPEVLAAVMAELPRTRQEPRSTTAVETPSKDVATARRPAFRAAVASALVAAAMAAGFAGIAIRESVNAQHAQDHAAVAAAVVTASDAVTTPGRVRDGGNAAVVVSASLDEAVLMGHDLPALPQGQVYRAWLVMPDGAVVAAGDMPGEAGGMHTMPLDGHVNVAVAVAMTTEPPGGSKPSGPYVFRVVLDGSPQK